MRWILLLLVAGCADSPGFEGDLVPLCGDELICNGWCMRGGSGVTDHTICVELLCHKDSACCVQTQTDGLWVDIPEELCADCPICYPAERGLP